MLNQFTNVTAEQYRDAPARLSSHILRNGLAGIGHRNKALRRRPLALASRWASAACDATYVQFLNWNAGHISRNCRQDALNDVLASPYHIETIQEASTVASQPALFESRGIESVSSRDCSIMINSGGAGHKMVRKTHSEAHAFCDWIQRPSKYDLEPPKFDPVAIAAEELDILLTRQEQQEDAILMDPEPFLNIDLR